MADERNLADDVLDRALEAYGRAEPCPGLEERVVAALRREPRRPSWLELLRGPRPALAGLALLLAAALLVRSRRAGEERPVPAPQPAAGTVVASAPTHPAGAPPSPPPAPAVSAPARLAARAGKGGRAERRPVFPAPAPLAEQEELLLLYVCRTPPGEMEPRFGFLDSPAALPPLPDTDTDTTP